MYHRISYCIALSIGWLILALIVLLWAFQNLRLPALPTGANNIHLTPKRLAFLPALVNWHLLGYSPPLIDEQHLPYSQLPLVLAGIIYSDSYPQAFIRNTSTGQTLLYQPGDSLLPGVVLYKIRADKIILKQGEVLETLSLPQQGLF